jgi:hypothetical protein
MSKEKSRGNREAKKPKANKVKEQSANQGFASLHTPKPLPSKSVPTNTKD